MKGCLRPSTHHYLTITWANTSCVETCESMGNLIDSVNGVLLHMDFTSCMLTRLWPVMRRRLSSWLRGRLSMSHYTEPDALRANLQGKSYQPNFLTIYFWRTSQRLHWVVGLRLQLTCHSLHNEQIYESGEG